jgi:3-(methylsulfanyl)propanoyl-CoA dehydrogenase
LAAGSRALGEQRRHPDPARRTAAEDLVALLTPTVKALFTGLGFEATNLASRCSAATATFASKGWSSTSATAASARFMSSQRDANAIEALDLVGRKVFYFMT